MLEENIKENIKKCSRCALCVQNCPIFKIKKDENNTARGLVCKLSGYDKNILNEKEIKSDFKICLFCSKCKSSCPSFVNTTGIFAYKNAHFSPSKYNQKTILKIKLLPIRILYFLNIFKKIFKKDVESNVLYFKGCVARAQHKITYLDKIFKTAKFSCCGLPYLSCGDIESYKRAKEENIKLIKNASCVVFDCASCLHSVLEYDELDKFDKAKLMFFTNLIDNSKIKLKTNSKYKNKTITFHKPCHMANDEFIKIEEFLKSIEGLNYKRLDEIDSCCGFGGSYFMFHPIISAKIAFEKAKTIKNSKADLILTMCPSCVLGIRFNQLLSFNFKKTLELRDFIDSELAYEN